MSYTLITHGDRYEQRYWPELSATFPNYEIFWQRYIVPLTRRETDGSIHLRTDIDPLLEELSMAHYSAFYHLGVARELRKPEFFEDIFFHLSAATEMVENLVLSIAKVCARSGGPPVATQLDEAGIHDRVQDYWKGDYSGHFDRFLETGRSVNYSFHQIEEVAQIVFSQLGNQADKDYRAWCTIKNKIRHYRNSLAHYPRLGHFSDPSTGIRVVPTEDKLSNYKLWSSVLYKPNPNDFIKLEDLVAKYQADLEGNTNSLWDHLLNFLDTLSATDEYQQMTITNGEPLPQDHPTVLFESDESMSDQSVAPSGTPTGPLLEELQEPKAPSASGVHIVENISNATQENNHVNKDQES